MQYGNLILYLLALLALTCSTCEECPDGCPPAWPEVDQTRFFEATISHPTRGSERFAFPRTETTSSIRELPYGFQRQGRTSIVVSAGNFYFFGPSPFNQEGCTTLEPFYWAGTTQRDFYLLPNVQALLLEFTGLDSGGARCHPNQAALLDHLELGEFNMGSEPGDVNLILSGSPIAYQQGGPGSYLMDQTIADQPGTLSITELDTTSARYSTPGVYVSFAIDEVRVLDHMGNIPEPFLLTDIEGRIFIPY